MVNELKLLQSYLKNDNFIKFVEQLLHGERFLGLELQEIDNDHFFSLKIQSVGFDSENFEEEMERISAKNSQMTEYLAIHEDDIVTDFLIDLELVE